MLTHFSPMWYAYLGRISIAKHRIELLSNSNPNHSIPYQTCLSVRKFQQLEFEKMLSQNVIEPAQTEWAAPIVFAPKKDGSLRICVNYRILSSLTRRYSYPIPRMDECIGSPGEATVFSTLDANSGNWNVIIEDEYQEKTAFSSHRGLYRFIHMPIGLKNASETFQQTMDVIPASVKWQFALYTWTTWLFSWGRPRSTPNMFVKS